MCENDIHFTSRVLGLLTLLVIASSACAGPGMVSESPTEAAPSMSVTSTAVAATPSAEAAATPTPFIDHWTPTRFPAFEIVLELPADWEAVEEPSQRASPGTRFAGVNGFVELRVIRGTRIEDVTWEEARNPLGRYGSEPSVDELEVHGQPARLISASGETGDQVREAALIVSYPQAVHIGGRRYDFLMVWADREHIEAIAQTLRFTADGGADATPRPGDALAWDRLPPGLTFSTFEGLWQVSEDEEPVQIHADAQAVLSPDGRWLLSYDAIEQDAWVIDRVAGTVRSLTRSPERLECCFHWYPARPDIVVFGSTRAEDIAEAQQPPAVRFYPAAVRRDGRDYRILDADHPMNVSGAQGSLALAPDGRTIAYGVGQSGWLYDLDGGRAEPFDPLTYGLDVDARFHIAQPAWSPDGRFLAWVLKGNVLEDGSSTWTGVVVFDPEARTAQILHSYPSQGVGWPPAPVWSPDGGWLAFIDSSSSEEAGLWVAEARQSSEMHHLGQGGNPVWSPDGRWLAFQSVGEDGTLAYLALFLETWERRTLNLPADRYGQLVDWMHIR